MTEPSTLTLDERLVVYEAVICALKNQLDMLEMLEQFLLPQQLEAIRFMEFLSQGNNLYAREPTPEDVINAIFCPPLHRNVH